MRSFTKETGPKPSKSTLKQASMLVREQTGDHIAVAMAMRPNGVTQNEVIALLGHPHRNIIKRLLDNNQVKQLTLPDDTKCVRIKLIKK